MVLHKIGTSGAGRVNRSLDDAESRRASCPISLTAKQDRDRLFLILADSMYRTAADVAVGKTVSAVCARSLVALAFLVEPLIVYRRLPLPQLRLQHPLPHSRQQGRRHLPVVTQPHKVSRLPRIILEVEQQVGLVMTAAKLLISKLRIVDRFMETLDRNACDLLTLAYQFADGTGLQLRALTRRVG